MKILLISGFLGAGKTTFIKAMAKATGREFVIVENEFADQDIDGQLLAQDEAMPKMDIWEMAEGCICCSLDLDFSLSVLTIANTLNPDYLLVEPSGVAQPTSIIEKLDKISYERISLLAPITIIDADNYPTHQVEFKNYFDDQLVAAGTLVLSKSEHLSVEDFIRAKEELDVSEDVSFPTTHYSKWSKEDWLTLLNRDFTGEDIRKVGERFLQRDIIREADQDLTSLTLDQAEFQNPDELYHFLEVLLSGRYGQIIRAKGFVAFGGDVVHVELVQNQFSITGLGDMSIDEASQRLEPSDDKLTRNKLIVIGKHLDRPRFSRWIKS